MQEMNWHLLTLEETPSPPKQKTSQSHLHSWSPFPSGFRSCGPKWTAIIPRLFSSSSTRNLTNVSEEAFSVISATSSLLAGSLAAKFTKHSFQSSLGVTLRELQSFQPSSQRADSPAGPWESFIKPAFLRKTAGHLQFNSQPSTFLGTLA